jgi:hypothetical protein
MSPFNRLLVLMCVALLAMAAAEAPRTDKTDEKQTEKQPDKRPVPDKKLTPGQVVKIVMDALKNNDATDSGIAITFDFASPSNKEVTGPLERFIPMVKNETYAPMLNHKSAKYGKVLIKDDVAQQAVTLVDSTGKEAAYVFQLSKQTDGDLKGCWMTDGVMRIEPGQEPREPKLGDPPGGAPDRA